MFSYIPVNHYFYSNDFSSELCEVSIYSSRIHPNLKDWIFMSASNQVHYRKFLILSYFFYYSTTPTTLFPGCLAHDGDEEASEIIQLYLMKTRKVNKLILKIYFKQTCSRKLQISADLVETRRWRVKSFNKEIPYWKINHILQWKRFCVTTLGFWWIGGELHFLDDT